MGFYACVVAGQERGHVEDVMGGVDPDPVDGDEMFD